LIILYDYSQGVTLLCGYYSNGDIIHSKKLQGVTSLPANRQGIFSEVSI